MTTIIETFNNHLLEKVWCTNSFEDGLKVRSREKAIDFNYIGLNKPLTKYISLDIDRGSDSTYMFETKNMPLPTIITINPESGNCHYLYGLKNPVSFYENSRTKPQRYFEQTTLALANELEADLAFAHTIVKNPNSKHWKILEHDVYYDLEDFGEYLDINQYGKFENVKKLDIDSSSRNVCLFDNLRHWAYKEINVVEWVSFDRWFIAVESMANHFNDFDVKLPESEVRHTARSVAKWVWKHRDEINGAVNRGVMTRLGLISSSMNLEQKQRASNLYTADVIVSKTKGKIATAIIQLKSS